MTNYENNGRSTLLTQDKFEKIVGLIRNGNYMETASKAAGIMVRTFHNWMARGRAAADLVNKGLDVPANEELFLNFFCAVEVAKAEAESVNVLIIQQEAKKTWQAAAWMLERQYPDRWGRRDKIDATVNANVSFADGVTAAWEKRKKMMQETEPGQEPTDEPTDL